ncbi:MAG: bifunctional helix-turn-helix transcriptional regulator/GNAT family N-acetyltransferase [Candidatus Lokiarchaeota archaeon]|nr:bifunctional helix-turn-helix transcriptional regulator/GNAT family N-acetyltransferase [Candidatus Lokiarchaeota archaeon]
MKANLERIGKIRSFNRFYTNLLGLLERTLLKSDYSLTEVRIMFELNRLSTTIASELVKLLNLDPAYLSRILRGFEEKNFIDKQRSNEDMRKQLLSLTSKGQQVISELQEKANEQIKTLLTNLKDEDQDRLVTGMETIESILKDEKENSDFYRLRSHKPGDIGYITYRHGVIYANEYQLDETFEAYVAKYMAEFIENYDPTKDHLWIVEKGTEIVGSIAIVKVNNKTAQLRWLLVEPHVRNVGIGTKLVDEAISFCKSHGYQKVILGTFSDLIIARKLYSKIGFQLIESKSYHIWGQDLTEEQWEMILE